jgi:hypothetical protein
MTMIRSVVVSMLPPVRQFPCRVANRVIDAAGRVLDPAYGVVLIFLPLAPFDGALGCLTAPAICLLYLGEALLYPTVAGPYDELLECH